MYFKTINRDITSNYIINRNIVVIERYDQYREYKEMRLFNHLNLFVEIINRMPYIIWG